MSYAKVEVYAPDSKLKFQGGRTDRNGRFCFVPDAKGDWRAVINDGIGHQLELNALVDEHLEPVSTREDSKPAQYTLSRYERALMGLSILFGISGLFFWWKGIRERRRQDSE